LEGFVPGLVGSQPGGAADEVGVVMGDLGLQQSVGLVVTVDSFVSQQGDQALLEVAEAAFDFAFGGSIGSDSMGDAQGGECTLELGVGVEAVGG